MIERIRIRRDSFSNWEFYNPVLATGEAAYDTTTNRIKIGNGSSAWTDLPYLAGGSTSVLRLGNGGLDDSYIWYSSDRLNLIGSGSTSIFFDPNNNRIVFSTPTGTVISRAAVTGVLGYNPQPSGDYSVSGHTHDLYISNGDQRVITYSSSDDLKIIGSGNTKIFFNDTNNTIIVSGSGGTTDLVNVVMTTGNQNISGIKTFANTGNFIGGLYVSGIPVSIQGHTHYISDLLGDKISIKSGEFSHILLTSGSPFNTNNFAKIDFGNGITLEVGYDSLKFKGFNLYNELLTVNKSGISTPNVDNSQIHGGYF